MNKISLLMSLIVVAAIPASALADQVLTPEQEEATNKVLWRTQGRARPSRRAIKAKVFDEMKESSTTFTTNQLEQRRIQQQRTFNDLRSSKQKRSDESKDERIANQLEDRAEVLDRNNNRLQERLKTIEIKTVRSVSIDVRKCDKLHVRARRMCIIDLRRDERIRMHRGEVEAIREELDISSETKNVPNILRVNRRLPAKPISRRSTNSPQTGPAEIFFPEEVEEAEDAQDESADEGDQQGVQSQTSG